MCAPRQSILIAAVSVGVAVEDLRIAGDGGEDPPPGPPHGGPVTSTFGQEALAPNRHPNREATAVTKDR